MDFLGIGFGPILVLLVLVLILFGPSKLPETARAVGKYTRALKKMSSEITEELSKQMDLDESPNSIAGGSRRVALRANSTMNGGQTGENAGTAEARPDSAPESMRERGSNYRVTGEPRS